MTITIVLSGLLSPKTIIASENSRKILYVYHDTDYSNHARSAHSMKMGFEAALSEVSHKIRNIEVKLLPKDHRGNSLRSKITMQKFLNDPDALFILGGLHSSPYIQYRDFINENEILLFIAWAAGGPITRYDKDTNWVFRLSLDDTKVGGYLAHYAANHKSCKKPHLLLESTPWGQSNHINMTKSFQDFYNITPQVSWFNWNTKENTAKALLRNIYSAGSDCILFVGNSLEGKIFVQSHAELAPSPSIPIISHWGITGGNFVESVGSDHIKKVDLSFIQSCFSFLSSTPTETSELAYKSAQKLYPDIIKNKSDIKSPSGFVHAYDIAKIIINRLEKIDLNQDIKSIRSDLRLSLEKDNGVVQGLIKAYETPFEAWSKDNDDAHEALSSHDYCMASFSNNDTIHVLARDNYVSP